MGVFRYAVVQCSYEQWHKEPDLYKWNHVKLDNLEEAQEIKDEFRSIGKTTSVVAVRRKDVELQKED